MIACGGDHAFAVTQDDRVFGWGRNNEAQLGLKLQQDYMNRPTEVETFRSISISRIYCGPNYSAVITSMSRLMVAGSMEFGKLGLGHNLRSGFALEFTEVSRLKHVSIKDVSCGPRHILAIAQSSSSSSGTIIYAWGSNSKGQLGIDSTETSYVPKKVKLQRNEKFE